ncbi:5934_t:CDS:1, partial [Gigaspora rosea]
VINTEISKFAYTRHEPIGVYATIIPWNFPHIDAILKNSTCFSM